MGRTKEFNSETALEKAMHLFWEKGYENTSLKELLKKMGILNGSFYNSYGNKKQLFIAAMTYYEKDFSRKRELLFQNPNLTFQQKIKTLFSHILDRQKESHCPKGCFLFNSVGSDITSDMELFNLVRTSVARFEEFLQVEISHAIERQELDASIDPALTASLLVAYSQGLMKLSVMDYSDTKFRRQTEYFLKSLGLSNH